MLEFKYDNTMIFKDGDKTFVLDKEKLVLAQIDKVFEEVINVIKRKEDLGQLYQRYSEEEVQSQVKKIQLLMSKDLFFSNIKNEIILEPEYNVGLMSLPTVHQCNLRCTYCFADHGDNFKGDNRNFEVKQVEKALRYIYEEYMPQCKRYRIDFVSGGEPLLNFDVIKEVHRVGKELYKETGKPLEIWLCTNGTQFTEEILHFLSANYINIGVSLDGNKGQHDKYRKNAAGEGTYDVVVKNIRGILDNKSYSTILKNIWGLVVVTSQTGSLVEILKHHCDLGLKNVQMKIVRCEKNTGFDVNSKNIKEVMKKYDELIEYFIERAKENDFKHLSMILNDNDTFGKIICRLLTRQGILYRCQAGKNKVSIEANGDLFPCDSFVGNEEYKLGNIFEGITNKEKKDLFETIYVEKVEACSSCWAKYICGGDCYNNAYRNNGVIDKPDTVFCELNQYLIRRALVLVYELNSIAPKAIQRITKVLKLREQSISLKG